MDVWSVELISAFYHHCLLKFAMSMVFMGIGNFQNDLAVDRNKLYHFCVIMYQVSIFKTFDNVAVVTLMI